MLFSSCVGPGAARFTSWGLGFLVCKVGISNPDSTELLRGLNGCLPGPVPAAGGPHLMWVLLSPQRWWQHHALSSPPASMRSTHWSSNSGSQCLASRTVQNGQQTLPGMRPLGGTCISEKEECVQCVLFLGLLKDARGKEREGSPLSTHQPAHEKVLGHALK